ncbi:MAG: GIY-YIG nuclease family protein [Armatimonadota bacterium]
MTGSYVLVISLDRERAIEVGALGEIDFPAGAYAYVGSAMGGLDARIARHLRDDRRLHWHVDYLLQHAEVVDVLRVESEERMECAIAAALADRLACVAGFGASDCTCESHLFGPATVSTMTTEVRDAAAAADHAGNKRPALTEEDTEPQS